MALKAGNRCLLGPSKHLLFNNRVRVSWPRV